MTVRQVDREIYKPAGWLVRRQREREREEEEQTKRERERTDREGERHQDRKKRLSKIIIEALEYNNDHVSLSLMIVILIIKS